MRKELYKDSKLIEVEEIIEQLGKVIFQKYDGQLNLLESRNATEEEKQLYAQEQLDIQEDKDRIKIKTLAEKVSNLTNTEIQEALKLILKHIQR